MGKKKSIHLLNSARKEYVQQWSNVTAKYFEENQYYEWMAGFIHGYKYVLEIGTGDGRATLELLKRGHSVVSIEENRECIRAAKNRICNSGQSVKVLFRETIKEKDEFLCVKYKGIVDNLREVNCIIVEGDLLNDPKLFQWLGHKEGLFDAVICWLIGTHNGRFLNKAIEESRITSPSEYRFAVQNKVYEIADVVLRKGGILNVIDRGGSLVTDEVTEDCLNSHRDQASVTSLEVQGVESMVYKEPECEGALEIVTTKPSVRKELHMSPLSFASVISKKPS